MDAGDRGLQIGGNDIASAHHRVNHNRRRAALRLCPVGCSILISTSAEQKLNATEAISKFTEYSQQSGCLELIPYPGERKWKNQ